MLGRSLVLGYAIAAAISACSQPSDPTSSPLTGPSATSLSARCIDQFAWEPHEGAFTGHWEAADRAIASHDGPTGSSEARLAASELRAMAALASVPDPNVAGHLSHAAFAVDLASVAFANGLFQIAKKNLSDAASEHEVALASTSAKDWC